MKRSLLLLPTLALALAACGPASPESAAASAAESAAESTAAAQDTTPEESTASSTATSPAGALRDSSVLDATDTALYTLTVPTTPLEPGSTAPLQVLRLDYATAKQDCVYTVELPVGDDGRIAEAGSLLALDDTLYLFVGQTMYKIPAGGGTAESLSLEQLFFPTAADDTCAYSFTFNEGSHYFGSRLDLATGQITDLKLPSQTWDIWAVGESRFLLCHLVTDMPLPSVSDGEAYNAALQVAVCEYEWYDPSTGELEKVLEEPYYGTDQEDGSKRERAFLGAADGRLYFTWRARLDGEVLDAGVESCDFTGGDWQPLDAIPRGDEVTLTWLQNGSLRWLGDYRDTNSCLIYDLRTGKVAESVPIDDGSPKAFTGDDRVLIDVGYTDEELAFHEEYQLAGIDDYLAGSTDWTPVTMYSESAS